MDGRGKSILPGVLWELSGFLPSSSPHTLFFLTTDSTAQYQLKQFAELCRI